jgi:hypothetical protein
MSKIALEGNASGTGTFTIAGPNTNTNYTITLPQETGTLVTTGVTTGLNGSAITTGTVAASVGGTGLTSAGTNGNVLTSNGSAWVSQAAAAGGGDYIMQVFTTPGTWTKPAGLKAVKVTVIGGGGGATSGPSAPAGGTSSFGSPAFLSATGGGSGNVLNSTASGGTGSGGQLNSSGAGSYYWNTGPYVFVGGGSAFGFALPTPISVSVGGSAYGGGARLIEPTMPVNGAAGGGGGGAIEYIDAPALPGPQPYTVGTGAPATQSGAAGVIIVEEFY